MAAAAASAAEGSPAAGRGRNDDAAPSEQDLRATWQEAAQKVAQPQVSSIATLAATLILKFRPWPEKETLHMTNTVTALVACSDITAAISHGHILRQSGGVRACVLLSMPALYLR